MMFVHFCRSVIQINRAHQANRLWKAPKTSIKCSFSINQTQDCRNLKGEPPDRGVPQGSGLGLAHMPGECRRMSNTDDVCLFAARSKTTHWILCHFNVKNVHKKTFYHLENAPPPPHQCFKHDFLHISDSTAEVDFPLVPCSGLVFSHLDADQVCWWL